MNDTEDHDIETDETESEPSDIRSVAEAAYDTAVSDIESKNESTQPQSDPSVASPSGDQGALDVTSEPANQAEDDGDIPPPHGWAADKRDMWAGFNRDQKQYIYGRWVQSDRFIKKRVQELTERSKQYDGLDSVIQPRAKELALDGVRVEDVVGQALALRDLIRQNKQAAAYYFLEQIGVHPSHLMQGPQRPQVDPQILQLRQELDGYKKTQEEAARAQEQQLLADTAFELETIARERDQGGSLKFPLAGHLQDDMADLIPLIRREQHFRSATTRTIFEEAYKRAALYNPDTREIHLRQIQNSRLASQQKQTDRLKTAAVSVNGSPTGVGKTPLKRYSSVRAAAEAAYDEHSE